jgi:hypothetical protein
MHAAARRPKRAELSLCQPLDQLRERGCRNLHRFASFYQHQIVQPHLAARRAALRFEDEVDRQHPREIGHSSDAPSGTRQVQRNPQAGPSVAGGQVESKDRLVLLGVAFVFDRQEASQRRRGRILKRDFQPVISGKVACLLVVVAGAESAGERLHEDPLARLKRTEGDPQRASARMHLAGGESHMSGVSHAPGTAPRVQGLAALGIEQRHHAKIGRRRQASVVRQESGRESHERKRRGTVERAKGTGHEIRSFEYT